MIDRKNLKKQRKVSRGVTLIALVITIIVLLILAGITIITLVGNNGILNKTDEATEENRKRTATEILNLKITNAQIQSYTEKQEMPNLQYLADRLCEDNEIQYVYNESQKLASQEKIKVTGEYIYTKLGEYPYEFKIDDKLRLASINGIEIAENNTNYEDLIKRIEVLEKDTKYKDLEKRIEILESEKRVKLTNKMTTVSFEKNVGWKDGAFADIQLSETIKNYRYLEIQYDFNFDNNQPRDEKTFFIATEQLKNFNNSDNINNNSENSFSLDSSVIPGSPDNVAGAWCWFKSDTIFHIGSYYNKNYSATAIRILNIYGIK